MEIIETVRSEAQRRAKVERAMIEEEGLVLEEAVRVSTERQARAKAMRFERDRQIEAKWHRDGSADRKSGSITIQSEI